jgi:periplasmic copper chaperone A
MDRFVPASGDRVRGNSMSKTLLAFAALLLLAGGAAAQTGSVEVKNAWARATPGKAEDGAAYLTLESPTPDRLTGVSTPVAKKAELHAMTMEGGVMKMRPLAGIDLPAGQVVTLQPGAMHIMLFGLTHPLTAGQSFPLTLSFEKAGTREVTVNVEKTGAMGPEKATGGGMQMPMPAGK